MTEDGLATFRRELLVGRVYRPAFEWARKKYRATAGNVLIEIILTGEYPGDGKPKSVRFPGLKASSVLIDCVRTVALETLVELKLASGMTGAARRKDLADVQELIRVLNLTTAFATRLDPRVRALFLELHGELALEAEQTPPGFDEGE